MICPYQQGWKQCRVARKLEIKAWQAVAHFVKDTITKLLKKYKDDEMDKFFGPKGLIFCFTAITIIYSLTGIAGVLYNK
jgi:hypothetical protein